MSHDVVSEFCAVPSFLLPPTNLIGAYTDIEAVRDFVRSRSRSRHTMLGYARDCERFLLWCHANKNKKICDLTRQDFDDYFSFLADPQPAEFWCGPRAHRRSPAWRPFAGPLSPSSIACSYATLKSMMSYLHKAGYVRANPMSLMHSDTYTKNAMQGFKNRITDKCFTFDEWKLIVDFLNNDKHRMGKFEFERIRFMVMCLYFLGIRRSELQTHKLDNFVMQNGMWTFRVTGKGNKEAEIPVSSTLMDAMTRFRLFMGLTELPVAGEPSVAIAPINRRGEHMSSANIDAIIRRFLHHVADTAPTKEIELRLRNASAHWFRHTSISRQIEAGIPLEHVQQNARHANIQTTMIYFHAQATDRHDHMTKMSL